MAVKYNSHTSAYSCHRARSTREIAIATMPGRATSASTRRTLPVASVAATTTINHTVAASAETTSGRKEIRSRPAAEAAHLASPRIGLDVVDMGDTST